ncbi:MAG TPA: hypothetical protein VHH88_02170 [Verrucomicrobiae bacterium]|nr:hypothetical protein [Verrucomicrobiae bacterium]
MDDSDSSSPSLLDYVKGIVTTGADVYSKLNPSNTTAAKPATAAAAPASSVSKFLPWIIGGVVAVVLVVVFRRGK